VRNTTFDELPASVRDVIAGHSGELKGFTAASVGNHAEIAGVLRTDRGRVFVKGARLLPEQGGGAEAWSLRNEAAVNPHVRPYAPDLLWRVETDGWLLLGFEHIDGRHADYRPGSPDLDRVADVIEGLRLVPCPDVVRLKVEDRYTAPEPGASALAGSSLLHCDLNPSNVLITSDGTARVVDWAFCSRGAGWLEYGFLLPWMLRDGHSPEQAEQWLSRLDGWTLAETGLVDLFAGALARAWTRRDVEGAPEWVREYAAVVRAWNDYRGVRV
jgi:hypothetical protein